MKLLITVQRRLESSDAYCPDLAPDKDGSSSRPDPAAVLRGRLLAASMLLTAGLAAAQDSLRNSLAGDAAAESARQQIGSQSYNFKAGDFRLTITPSLELDYNDNINLAKTNAQQDFVLTPQVQLTGLYPATDHNLLLFSAGVGYQDYLGHSRYNQLLLTSGSLVSFDVFVKDFIISLHDNFSDYEDPATQSDVAGTASYGSLVNSAGLSITWDLQDVVLNLGYDHQNSISSTGAFDFLNHESELPLARAGFHVNSTLTVGVEGSASFTKYDKAVLNDNQSYSGGLYADWHLGSFLDVQPRFGYAVYQFQHTSASAGVIYTLAGYPVIIPINETVQTEDLDSWYANLSVSHQAAKDMSYGLDVGHEISLGVASDVVEDTYFRPNITWMIFKDANLNTSFFYEHGNTGAGNVTGNLVESYDWYGGEIAVSYSPMKKLLLTLSYRLTSRSSDIPDRDYAQNVAGIRLSYQIQ